MLINVIVANQNSEDSPSVDGIQWCFREEHRKRNTDYTLSKQGIREHVIEIREGGIETFEKRELKYRTESKL